MTARNPTNEEVEVEEITLFVMSIPVPACIIPCFWSNVVCIKVKLLSTFTPFIIALLAVKELHSKSVKEVIVSCFVKIFAVFKAISSV